MIKRKTLERIGAFQALVPIALGVVSMFIGALAGYAGLMICKIVVLIRFTKKTEKFCGIHISAAEPAA